MENDKQTSTYTLLGPSKLVPACNTRIQYSGCSLAVFAMLTIIVWEAKEVPEWQSEASRRPFQGYSSPVVAYTQLETSRNDFH